MVAAGVSEPKGKLEGTLTFIGGPFNGAEMEFRDCVPLRENPIEMGGFYDWRPDDPWRVYFREASA